MFLPPKLLGLFIAMQPDEQAHSYEVFHELLEKGENNPDLLTAALLHDAGKSRHKLHIWERVWIVVGKALFPRQIVKWGVPGEKDWEFSWRRAFVIAEQHPAWGAQMAEEAGASPLVVRLIRWHQEDPPPTLPGFTVEETHLLKEIRQMDGLK